MLTKNFFSFLRATLQGINATYTLTNGTTQNTQFANVKLPLAVMTTWGKVVTSSGVSFGTGTTQATVEDYCLESILGDTQISASPPSQVSFSRGDSFDEYSVSFGVTNTTDEAITISEVGLTAAPYYTGSNDTSFYALVDRTVLDTPVTIPAHETKHIAYTIRFNYGA